MLLQVFGQYAQAFANSLSENQLALYFLEHL